MKLAITTLVAILGVRAGLLAATQPEDQELRKLSLEQLMTLQVTVVTRQPEPIGSAAAAISVISREDIRRSGVTTIPDALALADGLHVARFNNGSWAITARGFNGSTPNKLLVMIDGRTEFTPLFTGVFWNILDYVLDDIERIEVIRGPGATLWGANAVNGVVNIITRNSRDTHGTLISLGAGREDPALLEARYGAGSDAVHYRVYGKFAQRDAQRFSTGGSSADTRRRGQAGFRVDADLGGNQWLVKGDLFHSRDAFVDRRDGEWTGIALQGRLTRELAPGSAIQLQGYYRREYRNIERQLTHYLDTGDIDFQHTTGVGSRHSLIWGAGYRADRDVTFASQVISFEPASRLYPVTNVYVQDEFAVRPTMFVTAGLKLEHNAFSGRDWQPNVRWRWQLPRDQMLWTALARAVRRPTRFDDDIRVTAPNGAVLVQGTDGFRSEVMTGWELGYRVRPISRVALDAVVFVHDYDRLRSQEAPPAGPIPLAIGNSLNGRSSGIELSADAFPSPWWRVHGSYTYLATGITRDPGSRDVSNGVNEANDPAYIFSARSSFDLARNLEADAWLRGVGALPNPAVPAYVELNARLAWRPRPKLELALTGQDLLNAQHPEFGTAVPRRIEFQRSIRASLLIRLP